MNLHNVISTTKSDPNNLVLILRSCGGRFSHWTFPVHWCSWRFRLFNTNYCTALLYSIMHTIVVLTAVEFTDENKITANIVRTP